MKRKDIETMHADGLITDEQRIAIIERYHLNTSSSRRWLSITLSLLATALIVSGIGMLVAAHWAYLTPLHKTTIGLGTLAAVWAAYFAIVKKTPLLAEGLAVIGAGVWAANIALHGNIFCPDTPEVEAVFLYFVGIAFIPFISRQRLLIGVVAICSVVLLMMMNVTHLNSTKSWLELNWADKLVGNLTAALALLGCFWWLVGEKTRKMKGIFSGYYWISILTMIAFIAYFQAVILHTPSSGMRLDRTGYILLAAAPVLCLLLKPAGTSWLCWALLAGATCLLAPLSIHLSWHRAYEPLIGTAACSLYAIILMFVGTRSGRIAWINYGSLMAFFVLLSVLSNIFHSLENSGIALVICGILLLTFSVLLGKQHRRLINKAKQQIPSVPKL